MRLSRRRLNRTLTATTLPVLALALRAVLAWRNLDALVPVPVRALVLAAGGASCLDVAHARDWVFLAGATTETGGAFFFFFFFLFTAGRSTGGLLLGILLGLGPMATLETDWVWYVIERVARRCA